MVTSANHRWWAGDVEISDLSSAGLPTASIVRTAKIATVEEREAQPIGCMPLADRAQIRQLVSALLDPLLTT